VSAPTPARILFKEGSNSSGKGRIGVPAGRSAAVSETRRMGLRRYRMRKSDQFAIEKISDRMLGVVQTVRDLLEHTPLLVPVDPVDNRAQVSLVEALEGRQKKDLFLNVWSEIE
jgi:hypothetical protein